MFAPVRTEGRTWPSTARGNKHVGRVLAGMDHPGPGGKPMPSTRSGRALAPAAISTALALALTAPGAVASKETYRVRSLVSDAGVPAEHIDKTLVNAWGIAFGTGPVWIADNGTGKSTIYDGKGNIVPLVVTIPQGAPTGIVFNGTPGFVVGQGKRHGPSLFIFAS